MPTDPRPRARDLLALPGRPGPHNAITDVPGVTVGLETLVSGTSVRTGVTAILPRGRDGVGEPCAAASYSLNGNGELTGTTWIEESGALTMPVLISNTHAVGACHTGTVEWVNEVHPQLAAQWLLPVCGETWDGYLNDINGGHVRPEHARAALDAATAGPVPEGSVGGGTGMNCYAFKGGTGTSSREVEFAGTTYTLGVLVQANFGDRRELVVAGTPIGQALGDDNPMEDSAWFVRDLGAAPHRPRGWTSSLPRRTNSRRSAWSLVWTRSCSSLSPAQRGAPASRCMATLACWWFTRRHRARLRNVPASGTCLRSRPELGAPEASMPVCRGWRRDDSVRTRCSSSSAMT